MTDEPNSADRRAASRLPPSAEDCVIINNVRFPLRNWSPVGLLFGPMAVPPRVGDKITLKVSVMLRNERHRFDTTGDVLRVVNGEVAVRYEAPSASAELIKLHFAPKK